MMEYYCFCNPKHVNMHAAAAVNVGYVGAGWFAAFIEKKMEMAGIDPAASRMQSERSTI